MKQVLIRSEGRLANHLIAWAKAMTLLETPIRNGELRLCVDWPALSEIGLPQTSYGYDDVKEDWITAPYYEDVVFRFENCIWDPKDLWYRAAPQHQIAAALRSIMFNENLGIKLMAAGLSPGKFNAAHVRCGDYVDVDWTEPPIPLPPFWRARDNYFISALELCNEERPFPTLIATESVQECGRIAAKAYKAIFGDPRDPVFDLYALSKARVIVGSLSTFSQVASIIGNVPLLLPTQTKSEMRRMLKKAQ